MSEFTLVSLNLFKDLSHWNARRNLIVEQLIDLEPDLIALQEVVLKKGSSNAQWLADQLNKGEDEPLDPPYEVYLCKRPMTQTGKEALAVLSRFNIRRNDRLKFRYKTGSLNSFWCE